MHLRNDFGLIISIFNRLLCVSRHQSINITFTHKREMRDLQPSILHLQCLQYIYLHRDPLVPDSQDFVTKAPTHQDLVKHFIPKIKSAPHFPILVFRMPQSGRNGTSNNRTNHIALPCIPRTKHGIIPCILANFLL